MKLKPKGRKIYRQRSRFDRLRTFRSNTGAVVTTLLLVGILGFVGYSAGGPVLRFLQDRKVLKVPGQETETTSPPTEAEQIVAEAETVSEPTETEPVETEPATEPLPDIAPEAPEFRGYALPVSALSGETALAEALAAIPEDATHILVPLKTSGGSLYYATTLEDAGRTGAVKAAMPLETIYEMTAAGGAEPVAEVNALEDTIYPASFPLAAYSIAGSDDVWMDAASEEGGKPWLSPFSELTLDYMANLAGEIAQAGFTSIVCEGLNFPAFPEEDLEQLDPECNSADRYTALVNVVEAMQNAAPEAAFYVEVEGMDALNNSSEALAASEQLEMEALFVTVNSATKGNTELLHTLTTVHPSVLVWKGIDVPSEEQSFVQLAPSAEGHTEPET